MKKVFGVLSFLSFLFMLGSVGAVEQDTVPLLQGTIQMFLGLVAFALFARLAGAFEYDNKESRCRECSPTTASVKAHKHYSK